MTKASDIYPPDYLRDLPDLCIGQCCSLKIDTGKKRVWLCRVAGGVTVERYKPGFRRMAHRGRFLHRYGGALMDATLAEIWDALEKGRTRMKLYAIRYRMKPAGHHPARAAVVEAESENDALDLLRHELGDHSGVSNYIYGPPEVYKPPASKGRIVTMNGGQ